MKSVFKLSSNRVALAAAFGLVACGFTPAEAADLGGNCCADLEERIAELEATTARKGNRKVSLTVSGWVNEAVFVWDDGTERNVYVGTNGLEQSRFRFTGEAKIMNDWSAGYTLEIGVVGAASNRWDQKIDDGNTKSALTVRKSNWYMKSNTYGKVTVGLEGTATYHLLDDADATNTRNFSDAEAAAVAQGRFFLRSNGNGVGGGAFGTGLRWSDILVSVNNGTPGQNGRRNIVRYDSPELHGFVVTASWGEDDMGDVSLTYKANTISWGDFKVLAKAGFEHDLGSRIYIWFLFPSLPAKIAHGGARPPPSCTCRQGSTFMAASVANTTTPKQNSTRWPTQPTKCGSSRLVSSKSFVRLEPRPSSANFVTMMQDQIWPKIPQALLATLSRTAI